MSNAIYFLRSKAARMLGSSLSPCYLRVGGTAADRLVFTEKKAKDYSEAESSLLPIDGGSCAYEGELCSRNHELFNMTGIFFR